MPENSFSRSQSCVIVDKDLFRQVDSQQSIAGLKHGNVISIPQLFTFGPQFLVARNKLSLMKAFLPPCNFTDSDFWFFSSLSFNKILRISLWRFNFMTTIFDVWFKTITSNSCRNIQNLQTFFLKILFVSKASSFHCHESLRQFSIFISSDLYITLEFRSLTLNLDRLFFKSKIYRFKSSKPSKNLNVILTLPLGWCDITKPNNVKSTLKQSCVRQRWNSQRWATSNHRCLFRNCHCRNNTVNMIICKILKYKFCAKNKIIFLSFVNALNSIFFPLYSSFQMIYVEEYLQIWKHS